AERFDIARMNHQAGEKARSSAATEAAFKFFITGLSFLCPPSSGQGGAGAVRCADAAAYEEEYELSLKLTARSAESAYLLADFEAMDELLANGLAHARSS